MRGSSKKGKAKTGHKKPVGRSRGTSKTKGTIKISTCQVDLDWVKTNIPGLDELFEKGIPKGKNILVAGGPGTGKTIFCLQALYNAARSGRDSLYITFEEIPDSLIQHMREFGWKFKIPNCSGGTWNLVVESPGRSGKFVIVKQDPFKIARSVEALLAKAEGHLRIKMDGIPELMPKGMTPYMVALDSITALESAFVGKPESYRIYIEQLFRLFEETKATTFLITETEDAPSRFSRTGVEEFLADGVFVLYNFKLRDTRVRAFEILKLRGANHEKKIVPVTITGHGIEIFPNERIYEET